MSDTEIEDIYCVKCRKYTETQNGEWIEMPRNRSRLRGKCVICGKGKSVYTNKEGYFKQKNVKELAEAKKERSRRTFNRRAKKLGREILMSTPKKVTKRLSEK
jgi:hypothetical protein